MAWSEDDSRNLERVADALDPQPPAGSEPSPPMGLLSKIFAAALIALIPAVPVHWTIGEPISNVVWGAVFLVMLFVL